MLPYKDGAIVYSIPNLWRLRDTDGDGKCDKREVLVSGFGHRDTHGMINGLTLGFDGWVYCNHGYSNDSVAKGTDGSVVQHEFRQRLPHEAGRLARRDGLQGPGQPVRPLHRRVRQPLHVRLPLAGDHAADARGGVLQLLQAARRPRLRAGHGARLPRRDGHRRRLLLRGRPVSRSTTATAFSSARWSTAGSTSSR